MATRGQVKRAIAWADYLAKSRLRRKADDAPRCVTCGGEADGQHARGEPRYACRHDPIRIDDATLDRGRRELGA
jgi:hypothetical protein